MLRSVGARQVWQSDIPPRFPQRDQEGQKFQSVPADDSRVSSASAEL
jgi:hypothetical protein